MPWLDDLLGKTIEQNGLPVPDRKLLNFLGTGVTVADNPATKSTDVTIAAITLVGKDPLAPQSNGGTSAYPTNPSYVIASGVTFVRGGAADHDSVRFFGAGGGEPVQVAYNFGQIRNITAFVIDLYPLLTQHIFLSGADQGAGNPIEIAPGSVVQWAFDASLNVHI